MGIAFLVNAVFAALNIALFAAFGEWWNLAAGVFSGLVALYCAAVDA